MTPSPASSSPTPSRPATLAFLLGGAVMALLATSTWLVLAVGTFEEGRAMFSGVATVLSLLAAALLAAPRRPRAAKALGVTALAVLAGGMLVMVFDPGLRVERPGPYQLAGIALVALVLARLLLARRRSGGSVLG